MAVPNILAEVVRLIDKLHRETMFFATVVSTSGGGVQVQRDGAATADGIFYAAANGLAATLSVGHRVLVMDASGDGGCVVVCRVVT